MILFILKYLLGPIFFLFYLCPLFASSSPFILSDSGFGATGVLPLTVTGTSIVIGKIRVYLFTDGTCNGGSLPFNDWTLPPSGLLMHAGTYLLSQDALLNTVGCQPTMQGVQIYLFKPGAGFGSPSTCQQATCTAGSWSGTGTPWSITLPS